MPDKQDDRSPKLPEEGVLLGTFDLAGKGRGTFIGGAAKRWAEPERDLLATADSFLKAADRSLNGMKREEGVEVLTVPGSVCAALACELYLKRIIFGETKEPPRAHQLSKLYDECSGEAQAAIAARRADIREVLERNRDHFVHARYHHEKEEFSFRPQELLQAAEVLSAYVHVRFDTA